LETAFYDVSGAQQPQLRRPFQHPFYSDLHSILKKASHKTMRNESLHGTQENHKLSYRLKTFRLNPSLRKEESKVGKEKKDKYVIEQC